MKPVVGGIVELKELHQTVAGHAIERWRVSVIRNITPHKLTLAPLGTNKLLDVPRYGGGWRPKAWPR